MAQQQQQIRESWRRQDENETMVASVQTFEPMREANLAFDELRHEWNEALAVRLCM